MVPDLVWDVNKKDTESIPQKIITKILYAEYLHREAKLKYQNRTLHIELKIIINSKNDGYPPKFGQYIINIRGYENLQKFNSYLRKIFINSKTTNEFEVIDNMNNNKCYSFASRYPPNYIDFEYKIILRTSPNEDQKYFIKQLGYNKYYDEEDFDKFIYQIPKNR